jgi:hypothetical protein
LGCAAITQLVECLAVNQDVTGSSPVGGVQVRISFIFWARSLVRLERPAHNRAVTGSNPVGPINQILSPDAGRSNNFCQKRKDISENTVFLDCSIFVWWVRFKIRLTGGFFFAEGWISHIKTQKTIILL